MNEVRFGIIGYGTQGSIYASILTGKPILGIGEIERPKKCKLTAISDLSNKAKEDFEQTSDVAIYTDWKQMIDEKACDAVILTVPHFVHSEITIYALNNGVHVLCEKPAAVRASDVEDMIETAKSHKELTFGLMLNQRTNNIYSSLKEIISSGDLGEIRRSNMIINSWWRPDSYYQSSPWRGTWSGEGGGLLVNQAPHQLDIWTWLCGTPSKVFAICKEGAYRDINVENDVTIITEYENGATGSFVSCTHDPIGTDRLEIDLSKGKIIVDNSNKATVYYFAEDETKWNETMDFRVFTSTLRRDPQSLYTTKEILNETTFGSDYSMIFANFADNVLNNVPLIAPGTCGLVPVQLANTAQLSANQERPLLFPCDTLTFNNYLEKRMKEEYV